MALDKQGFRFVFRGGEYRWVHALETQASDVDCTDMEDDEFYDFVVAQEAA